tara:strand:+ start:114 stop:1235 length:1122 start_codon:yes stop_codon:yes gene_type:complete
MAYLKSRKNKVGKIYYASRISMYKEGKKDIVISLGTSDYGDAIEKHEEVEANEHKIKQGKVVAWTWKTGERRARLVRKNLGQLIEDWLVVKKVNVRIGTYKRYQVSMKAFVNAIGRTSPLSSISTSTIESFKKFYRDVHTPNGININLRSIKCFLKWASEEGHIKEMPKIKMLKETKSKPKMINDYDWDRLMALDISDYWKDVFTLYRDTGIRRKEGICGYIDGDFLIVKAEDSKTGIEREIPLTQKQVCVVYTIKEALDKHLKKGSSMVTFEDKFTKVFTDAMKELGLDLTFHCLRHTFAGRKYVESRDLYAVCKELGHTSIKTTEVYAQFNYNRLEQDFPSVVQNKSKTIDLDTPIRDTPMKIVSSSLRYN